MKSWCLAISLTLAGSFLVGLPTAEIYGSTGTELSASSGPLLASRKKNRPTRRRRGRSGVREKHITREKVVRGKDATNINLETVDIGGQRKAPLGDLINQNKADKNYDFVKIRLRWHPEMVQSASSLDAGR